MALFNFAKKSEEETPVSPEMESFLKGYSIEVMPRTAEKVEDFRALCPRAHAFTSPISRARQLRIWSQQQNALRTKGMT